MRHVVASLFLLLLTGCVAGQNIKLGGITPVAPKDKLQVTVSVAVSDQREYVVSGRKNPAYIGHYRAGFGNTWDVTTENKRPLAELLQQDLETELTGRGYEIAAGKGEKQVLVKIGEWNFDTYMNGRFWYTLIVEVRDAKGQVVVQERLDESRDIAGSFWTGAKYAFEKALPQIYREVVSKVADLVQKAPAVR